MMQKTMKLLLVAIVAVLTLGSLAEAAPKKVLRHRARHSTRVAAGATTQAVKKPPVKRKHRVKSAAKQRARSTTSKPR